MTQDIPPFDPARAEAHRREVDRQRKTSFESEGGFLSLIPFLGFLGFVYIFLTMGSPDKAIWESPAKATDGTPPAKPQCVAANPSPGVYEWRDCTPEELESKPKFFNTLTQRWE
jgi:hypothetical protein